MKIIEGSLFLHHFLLETNGCYEKSTFKNEINLFLFLLLDVCEGYKGHFCSVLPGYSLQNTVSVDRHHTEWNTDGQLSADNWMGRIYHKLIGADVPIVCQNLLREFLCHSTLPLCSTGMYF